MLCGTSFIVMGLIYVFAMVEAAARTSRAGWVVLFVFWTSQIVLADNGGIFLLLRKIGHGCNFEPELCAKTQNKDFPVISEGIPLLISTGKCFSASV